MMSWRTTTDNQQTDDNAAPGLGQQRHSPRTTRLASLSGWWVFWVSLFIAVPACGPASEAEGDEPVVEVVSFSEPLAARAAVTPRGGPLCGNGVLDIDEECDPGLDTDSVECDAATCTCDLGSDPDSAGACDPVPLVSWAVADAGVLTEGGAAVIVQVLGAPLTTTIFVNAPGSARPFVDYNLSFTRSTGNLTITPIDDALEEGTETATLQLGDNASVPGYDLDPDGILTIAFSIQDNDNCTTQAPFEAVCVDGTCDEANGWFPDPSSTGCLPNCGDSIVATGVAGLDEECDDGGESAACNANCTLHECGDGTLNTTAGEECDDAGESATCNVDCSLATCGDNQVNTTAGESCDEGTADTPTCNGTSAAAVALGVQCQPKQCNDGYVNTTDGAGSPPEVCDTQGVDTPTCNAGTCQLSVCGDSYRNPADGEQCDEGPDATATCNGATGNVNTECDVPECLDGFLNTAAGEACDDGVETATCDANCTVPGCGDGDLNAVTEQCDPATGIPATNASFCDEDCTAPVCGDGHTNALIGEQCDNLGGGNTAGCNGNTAGGVSCRQSTCGDQYVNAASGEQCDNGPTDTASCNGASAGGVACRSSTCGDNYANAADGEACDSGGVNAAGCDADCSLPVCNDGTLNLAAGEVCDGTSLNGATCAGVLAVVGAGGTLSCAPGCGGFDTSQCDRDNDGVPDAIDSCIDVPNEDIDTDEDGIDNACDEDDDGDNVPDGNDANPLNGSVCSDQDADNCDDCSSGTFDPTNDGTDTDRDGTCNISDTDDDNDGVQDADDSNPLNASQCSDEDADTCDDCTSTVFSPAADGLDTDQDGLCNAGDPDDDNDGIVDEDDPTPLGDGGACGDADNDFCDDCALVPEPGDVNNDGPDNDADGACDAGDTDDDNDGVDDNVDADPLDPAVCGDSDADTCDDCSAAESMDADGDGICDDGEEPVDSDVDSDGIDDPLDNCPNDANPAQEDLDEDGTGDVCDPDRDGDGVSNDDETEAGSDPDDDSVVGRLIDAAGGSFTTPAGVTVTIPPNAITPSPSPVVVRPASGVPLDELLSGAFDLTENGVSIELPGTLEMLLESPLPGDVVIARWDDDAEMWVPLAECTVESDRVQCDLDELGVFGVVRARRVDGGLEERDAAAPITPDAGAPDDAGVPRTDASAPEDAAPPATDTGVNLPDDDTDEPIADPDAAVDDDGDDDTSDDTAEDDDDDTADDDDDTADDDDDTADDTAEDDDDDTTADTADDDDDVADDDTKEDAGNDAPPADAGPDAGAATSNDDGGCSCKVPGNRSREPSGSTAWLLVLLGLAAFRRLRRSATAAREPLENPPKPVGAQNTNEPVEGS